MINVMSYKISKAVIKKNGSEVDIAKAILELNLYESLDDLHYHGTLAIIDNYGLIEDDGIDGSELIQIQIKSDNIPNASIYTFAIRSVDRINLPQNGAGNSTVVLTIVSHGYSKTDRVRIAQSFKDSYNRVLEDVFGRIDEKINIFGNTISSYKTIIPNLSFNKTVRFITKRMLSPSYDKFYVYQTLRDSYTCKSLDYIFNDSTVAKYSYKVRITDPDKPHKNKQDYYNILDFEVKNYSEKLRDRLNGLDSGTIEVFNMIKGTIHKEVITSDTDDVGAAKYMSEFESNSDDRTQQSKYFLNRFQNTNNKMLGTNIVIKVPGNWEIASGEKIQVELPTNTTVSDISQTTKNKKVSGEYVIKGIRHKYTGGNFVSFLELIKTKV